MNQAYIIALLMHDKTRNSQQEKCARKHHQVREHSQNSYFTLMATQPQFQTTTSCVQGTMIIKKAAQ